MRFNLSLFVFLTIGLALFNACQTDSQKVKNADSKTSSDSQKVENAELKTNSAPDTPAPKTDAHGHEDAAERISLAEAKKEFDAGTAVFVDTRDEASYQEEHIKGAINIPTKTVASRYKEIPTGKKIIAYCS